MTPEYLEIAARRASTIWEPYGQPEDYGYDFREWISPYTKGAHTSAGIAIVLQDWASADGLTGGPDPDVQKFGRTRSLLTNRRLETALFDTTGLSLKEVYATNAFPFIKPGGMSANLRMRDLLRTIEEFTKPELELANPTLIVALGSLTQKALARSGVDAVPLPHPAARGMSGDDYCEMWRDAICGK